MNESLRRALADSIEGNRQAILSRGAFRVAVTGHRMNRLTPENYKTLSVVVDFFLQEFAALLAEVKLPSFVQRVIVSALAEGADRLVAIQGLKNRWALEVILPFSAHEYQNDFATQRSKEELEALCAAARHVEELPNTRAQVSPTAYESVGRALVTGSDLLIAIWDGQPSHGPGGTADVVALAQHQQLPIVWIHPDTSREPRFL